MNYEKDIVSGVFLCFGITSIYFVNFSILFLGIFICAIIGQIIRELSKERIIEVSS